MYFIASTDIFFLGFYKATQYIITQSCHDHYIITIYSLYKKDGEDRVQMQR
jgi:hypothetical protein